MVGSCLQQARILSRDYSITLLTDTSSGGPAAGSTITADGLRVRRLTLPALRWLHRLAHVPRQWLFLLAVSWQLLGPGQRGRGQRGRGPLEPCARRPAAVIMHSHPAAAMLAVPLRRLLAARSILVVHGDIFERPADTYDRRLTAWYRWATPRAYRQVDGVLSLSPAMSDLVRRWRGNRGGVHLVPNAINPAEIGLSEAAQPPLPEPTDLLFVGRIEPVKGIDVLLRAVALLRQAHPNLTLRCLGSIAPTYRAALQQLIEELAVADALHWQGAVPREQLGRHYRSCQVLVVPSRSEPQATVILEGMAASCAIVASDVGGNPMMIESGRSGLLVPPADPRALASSIDRLLRDPELRRQLGTAAEERCRGQFSLNAVAPKLRKAVAEILQ